MVANSQKFIKSKVHKVKLSTFNFRLSTRKGFALLFAMFVSSIMLSIGLGISNVIYKELILSGIGRESEYSFYTAQTGLECALYLQNVHPALFPQRMGESPVNPQSSDLCAGSMIANASSIEGLEGATTTFDVIVPPPDPNPSGHKEMCAQVLVFKSASNYITVESRGYNVGCSADDLRNPRRVERSLKLRTNIVTGP